MAGCPIAIFDHGNKTFSRNLEKVNESKGGPNIFVAELLQTVCSTHRNIRITCLGLLPHGFSLRKQIQIIRPTGF